MRKIYSVVLAVLFLMSASISIAQMTSLGRAPEGMKLPPSISNDNPTNANNRGFVYLSTTSHQMASQWMGSTTLTNIGAPQSYGFPGAFVYKGGQIYCIDQLAPFGLYTLDTVTGAKTLVVNVTGITLTNLTGLTYDGTTWWGVQSSITASQIGSINISTGAFTPVGSPSTACAGAIMVNAAPNGTLWSVDIVADALFKWDKTTGVATNVGALGVNANYGQDGHFDMSDGKYYWAAYTTGPELRIIDTTNGSSTVIGTYTGQISCLAIVAESGPTIVHTPLPNTQNVAGPYVANATITPSGAATITGAKVFWSRNNVLLTDSISMTNSGSNYSGSIPGNSTNATYRYQIRAFQSDGKFSQTGVNTFIANAIDTIRPVITHTPIINTPKSLWPVTVTATVTDNIGVDSAWVIWRINSGVNKRFKLTNTSGNTYSALFNSLNPDVNPSDIITYRIFAQDNSAQHNRDSSASYNFTIINLVNVCVGTGTVSSNYPFTTYWGGGRTQMLFTAAEVTAAGGVVNALVNKIGFNVLTRDPGIMNQFNINIQNTTLTTLSTYINSGWSNIYTGTYTVPGTGLQYIDCPSSTFHWDGTNLLLEVCYTNPSYTQYSTVAATTMTGMQLGYYMDGITGCATALYNTVTARPNVCFTMIPATGVTPVVSTIPTVYSLSQNYPNPFNPVTKINFALPKQGFVTLKIYDVLGREVRTLVNEVKSAGQFSVDFNASEFASGVYFYRLESNGFSDIKRMMLIK